MRGAGVSEELAGKVAIVTGGATGLGRGVAELFVAEGARVVIADTDEAQGRVTAGQLGEDALFVPTDVADREQVRALVERTVAEFGGLDVLVNNAGLPSRIGVRFLDDDFAEFHRVMDVNVLGVLLCTQHAARHMVEHGGGSVVTMTSIAALQNGPGVLSYRASKSAVTHVSRSIALDLADRGVRVNCIAPGMVPTSLLEKAGGAGAEESVHRIRTAMAAARPLPNEGTARDVAEAALYLASDRSRYVTGIVLPVDGGSGISAPPRPAATPPQSAP
jgi:NAD(P)-dependent dehydrogenase (short-subunit alcohol dehydrogenase family)